MGSRRQPAPAPSTRDQNHAANTTSDAGGATDLGTLALIGLCGLCGPLLSVAGGDAVPSVVGEILAGVLIGRTGLGLLNATAPTLTFLSDVGFAMLMFSVGMHVPLRSAGLRASLGRGTAGALLTALLALPAGLLAAGIGGAGHAAVYAVLLASSSAAVVLPIIQERRLEGPGLLILMAQVTVADILATLAIPFVLAPRHAARAALGTLATVAGVLVTWGLAQWLRRARAVQRLRQTGKHERWAIDLRAALTALFGLAWIAQRTGASLLIAGFGAGLMVAAVGGPKRLGTEVLGVAGGFFVPLYFVLLGARLDLRGVFSDPAMLGLAGAVCGLAVLVHVVGALLTRQSGAAGLLASAQLGVPAAVVTLGLSEHVIGATRAGAIITAAMLSLVACAAGARLLERSAAVDGGHR